MELLAWAHALLLVTVVVVGAPAYVSGARRARIVARYPLVLVTCLLVAPYLLLCLFAFLMSWSTDPMTDGGFLFAFPGWAGTPLCVLVVVMCARAALGRAGWLLWVAPVTGFGAPLVCLVVLGTGAPDFLNAAGVAYWLLVSAACGTNGVLALWKNAARKAPGPYSAEAIERDLAAITAQPSHRAQPYATPAAPRPAGPAMPPPPTAAAPAPRTELPAPPGDW